jgi:hypothetical protein
MKKTSAEISDDVTAKLRQMDQLQRSIQGGVGGAGLGYLASPLISAVSKGKLNPSRATTAFGGAALGSTLGAMTTPGERTQQDQEALGALGGLGAGAGAGAGVGALAQKVLKKTVPAGEFVSSKAPNLRVLSSATKVPRFKLPAALLAGALGGGVIGSHAGKAIAGNSNKKEDTMKKTAAEIANSVIVKLSEPQSPTMDRGAIGALRSAPAGTKADTLKNVAGSSTSGALLGGGLGGLSAALLGAIAADRSSLRINPVYGALAGGLIGTPLGALAGQSIGMRRGINQAAKNWPSQEMPSNDVSSLSPEQLTLISDSLRSVLDDENAAYRWGDAGGGTVK